MKAVFILLVSLLLSLPTNAQRVQRCENGLYGLAVKKNNGNVKWLTKPKYTSINSNYNGSFSVCNEKGQWGVVSSAGKEIIRCEYATEKAAQEAYRQYLDPSSKTYASNQSGIVNNSDFPDFTLGRNYSAYIKEYVEKNINIWQKKGEFEKTSDYQKRVTEESRKAKVLELTKEVCDECLARIQDKELRMSLGEYDADNETFLITSEIGRIVVPVKIENAPSFKKNWSKIISKNTYDIVNGKIVLRSALFTLNDKVQAHYSDQNDVLYAKANIQYNFDPIEVPLNSEKQTKRHEISENIISVGKSDIDMNIPSSNIENNKTFALIIANEDYREESNVEFANNDGQAVKLYFTNTLGIPQMNVHFIENATKNDIIREIDWLKNVASVYDKDINIYVYYAGHGVPNEADGSAYLIPVDGVGSNPKTLYSLAELYKELGEINSNSTILFLDACFSGALRGGGMLASARGVAIKSKAATPTSNMIVFTAATGDETAWPYTEKKHGLFTYFFLKKLQASKGNVNLGQLSEYIKGEVGKHSIVSNSKKQTPTINVSPQLLNNWENMKLK